MGFGICPVILNVRPQAHLCGHRDAGARKPAEWGEDASHQSPSLPKGRMVESLRGAKAGFMLSSDCGFDREHAEDSAIAIRDFVMQELATKTDLKETAHRLTVWLGAIVAAVTGLTVGIVALLIRSHP